MSWVMLSISPPASVFRPLVIPRTKPSEWTLLPTTMFPGAAALLRQAVDLVARQAGHHHVGTFGRFAIPLAFTTAATPAPDLALDVAELLLTDPESPRDRLARVADGHPLVLGLDQCEEYFAAQLLGQALGFQLGHGQHS